VGCVGADPFAASGGGQCINGGWVPNSSLSLCSGIPDPFVIIGGGVCINGGWVPRTALGTPAPEMTAAAGFKPAYSQRSATIGSMRVARRAGTRQATSATAMSRTVARIADAPVGLT
jgi:hypothetical protein